MVIKLYKIFTIGTLLILSFIINSPEETHLQAGDIVIKSIDPQSCDFTIATLVDLGPGASFIIADEITANASTEKFNKQNGAFKWVNDSGATIPAGSEIFFMNNASVISAGSRCEDRGTFNLSSSQIFILQEHPVSSVFIAGITWNKLYSSLAVMK